MSSRAEPFAGEAGPLRLRRRLFGKYVRLLVAVVAVPLLAIGGFASWSSYQDQKSSLARLQREQATAAAAKIGQFVSEIESQVRLTGQLVGAASEADQRRFALRLLLRQTPAITEVVHVDGEGREQLRISRLALDEIARGTDLSQEAAFATAMAQRVYYGPVYFLDASEPYMTLALAGARKVDGVVIASINLKFIWDVVTAIKVGESGRAFVVDGGGRLIAHPRATLVLRNTDLSGFAQVQRALHGDRADGSEQAPSVSDAGRNVLTTHAGITPPGWFMFVELPVEEAFAPVYASLWATGLVLSGGLALAVFASLLLARRMVTPIRALQRGAAQIGAGALDQRISIATGDELEALGEQFNSMAAQLQQFYETLERKVDERTRQLKAANLAKSRFLAAASHDLRQPLHALGLFVAQLRAQASSPEQASIVGRIDAAVTAMNELFAALLDISRLDAEVLEPRLSDFPIAHIFRRLETTFADVAHEKGIELRVVPSGAWVRSDVILLERIALNLASNAVRYTERGGVAIGARRHGNWLRLELWDTGPGIAEDQRRNIFAEFYQIAGSKRDKHGGLGLGLAIVERLCGLLDHRIELASIVGRGSRFSVLLPLAAAQPSRAAPAAPLIAIDDPCRGKLVAVIDDDPMVLDGMRGLLAGWGCEVVTAGSEGDAIAAIAAQARTPDLAISDYRLGGGRTGFEAIEALRRACRSDMPAFLITGDTAPERLREAAVSGFHLLHKPVQPMALRAMVNRFLRASAGAASLNAPQAEAAAAPSPAAPP